MPYDYGILGMGLEKGITFKSTYKSDMSGLRKDLTRLRKIRTGLAGKPILIPVKLDMTGIQADANKIANQIKSAVAASGSAAASAGTTASGLHLPKSSAKAINDTLVRRSEKRVGDKLMSTTEDHFGGKGKSTRRKTTHGEDGDITEEIATNNKKLAEFRDGLAEIDKKYTKAFNKAKVNKDLGAELDVLLNKAQELETMLRGTPATKNKAGKASPFAALGNEKEFLNAEKDLNKLNQRMNLLGASKDQKAKAAGLEKQVSSTRESLKLEIASNKEAVERAKATENAADREAKVNRLLNQRSQILKKHQAQFNQIDQASLRAGLPATAAKAHSGAVRASLDGTQLNKDRQKTANQSQRADDKKGLENAIRNAKRKAEVQLENNSSLQREAKLKLKGYRRDKEINRLLQERVEIRKRLNQNLRATMSTADKRGMSSVAQTASQGIHSNSKQGIRDLTTQGEAARKSGHAINFHTGHLLKNAATFARWSLAMQAVMAPLRALQAGFASMIEVDRQFATLRAVFQGTEEEAQRLKVQTIELASAQGQSSKAALDSAIRWSRFGLTRTQVLQQIETALVGANVAEMTSADTSERLAAIYSAWNLELSETAAILDSLNAISNRYNATNKGMLDGIVAGGAVAKQAGLDLQEYASLLSVGESAGFTGKEVGTATKFIFQRIRRPETLNKLKDTLDIDLTKSNGEIKSMSLILKELADIYPTLTGRQQTLLVNTVAGSRQAARFTTLLEGQREAQLRNAQAGFDSNSALRENEKILESMEAKINALKASWTQLWVAIGDTGALDLLASGLTQLSDLTATAADMLSEKSTDKSKKIKLTSRKSRAALGLSTEATEERISDRIKELNDLIKSRDGGLNFDHRFATSSSEIREEVEALELLLETRKKSQIAAQFGNETKELENLRKQVTALETSEEFFLSLANAVGKGIEPSSKLNKQWRKGAELLLNLTNGSKEFSENYFKISQKIADGDKAGAEADIRKLAPKFSKESPAKRTEFLTKQKKVYEESAEQVRKLRDEEEKLSKTTSDLKGDKLVERLKKIKEVTDLIQTLESKMIDAGQAINNPNLADGLGAIQKSNVEKYLKGVADQIIRIKDTLNSLSIKGGDSPERTFQRKMESLGLGLQSLQNDRTATQKSLDPLLDKNTGTDRTLSEMEELTDKQTAIRKILKQFREGHRFIETNGSDRTGEHEFLNSEAALSAEKLLGRKITDTESFDDVANALQSQLNLQQDAVVLADEHIRKKKEEVAEARISLEIAREEARLREAFETGSQDASINARRFRTGTTDTQKNIAQAKSLIALNSTGHIEADSSSAADILNKRAGMMQNEATAAAAILSLRQREADIHAVIDSTQQRITEAQEKQTKEVSKRLALASREDQLRAAMAAAATQDGPIGLDEFSFLSQNTRQAFSNYAPDSVRGLGGARDTVNDENDALEKEKQRIQDALSGLVPAFKSAKDTLDAFIKENPINTGNTGIKGKALENVFGNQKPAEITINAGAIHIDVSEQFERFADDLTRNVKEQLSSDIRAISDRVNTLMDKDSGVNANDFTQ